MNEVEVRCPLGPKRLLSKLFLSGEKPTYTQDGWIQFACSDCKRTLRARGREVFRVLHHYDFLGTLVKTTVE